MLNDMCEFMGDQTLAVRRIGTILMGTKHDIRSVGKRLRVQQISGVRSARVAMDPDLAEVVPKSGFQKDTHCRWQRTIIVARIKRRLDLRISEVSRSGGIVCEPGLLCDPSRNLLSLAFKAIKTR